MFSTVKRIISWCGAFKGKLYAGFVFSFFSHWFAAVPVMIAAYTVGMLLMSGEGGVAFDERWVWRSALLILLSVALRFLFDYMRSKCQEVISYELVARDRLAVGEALKRVSLGYFQQKNTGNILSSVTTGLTTLESMGIRMVDNFVGGYLNFLAIFLCLLVIRPAIALIALAAAFVSFLFLMLISAHSRKNAPVEAQSNKELTGAALEYARGLSVVKSFGQNGAAAAAMEEAVKSSRRIHLKIEWGFVPPNCLHLLALKCGSVGLALASCLAGLSGEMTLPVMLMFVFFSFSIFSSLEPVSDSAHILGVIDDAMNQLDALREESFLDEDGKDIHPERFDIEFKNVDFGYQKDRQVLKNVTFRIPQHTSTAIVGPSGSGKTTIVNLLARFYDVDAGSISLGGRDVREFTCDSLLSNISMVFQNVYLFHDTIRANICFGRPDATEEEMVEAAKKACCHEFIKKLPDGYDTVIGEGGGTLSGGEKQRISIARAMLKNAPVIILDEATASVDPENEHLIQHAISELVKGKTVITIAHRLATVENADQILVVNDGQIVQKGTHQELMEEDGIYRRFVEVRQRAEGWCYSQN
ncbi:ABC transporter, ATP-binding protein [Marvinbryantia formatexigens DSM 14469]|uniref:ABC transporter, ATP-binding protein n=1 Tax=Marvinbryantia formatexigens DSM 14469 TaxID=478749 RepID=C6LLX5_9FIRM|nr:ABC transporter ATP-binding protein [Marvinbryantia formatexigens]EET58385.1 ABC transporter, ATP-binding protein [Marvinbryantia formatexigens DSM 14469]UWO27048.1 ABC transporter ATP-binding protein/permease [Marvinbryantia formatexigens DSM 14469]SDF53802.1 ATP-binding cassette, subfamily B [Marvinbryantia formatexigens]